MKVVGVVLAAGLGTRLRPSTQFVPKPLIPVGGVEPLYFAIHRGYELGIRKFVVNAHYLSEQVVAACALWTSHFPGIQIRVSLEKDEILGTGGALLKILKDSPDWFKDHGLLLQNGDTLAQIPLKALVERPDESRFAVSYFGEHLQKYNPLWVDERGHWSGIGKAPPSQNSKPAHFLGVHYLSPKALKLLSNLSEFPILSIDLFNGIYRPLVNKGMAFQSVSYDFHNQENFWFDMTTQDFLIEAQHHVLDTLRFSRVWPELLMSRYPGIQELSPGVWSTCSNKNVELFAPAVWVEGSQKSSVQLGCSALQVGPHASFICERGQISQSASGSKRSVQNSVVFVSGNKNLDLVEDLANQLYVI